MKSVKFQGDILNFCDFIQVFVFTSNHHLNSRRLLFIYSVKYFQFQWEQNCAFYTVLNTHTRTHARARAFYFISPDIVFVQHFRFND